MLRGVMRCRPRRLGVVPGFPVRRGMCSAGVNTVVGGHRYSPTSDMIHPWFRRLIWTYELGATIKAHTWTDQFVALYKKGVRAARGRAPRGGGTLTTSCVAPPRARQYFGPATEVPFAGETFGHFCAFPRQIDLSEFIDGAALAYDAVVDAVYGGAAAEGRVELEEVVSPAHAQSLAVVFDLLRDKVPRDTMARDAEARPFLGHVAIKPDFEGEELSLEAMITVMFPLQHASRQPDAQPYSSIVFTGYDSRRALEDVDFRLAYMTAPTPLSGVFLEEDFEGDQVDPQLKGLKPVTNRSTAPLRRQADA